MTSRRLAKLLLPSAILFLIFLYFGSTDLALKVTIADMIEEERSNSASWDEAAARMKGPLQPTDPQLLRLIRNKFLFPPSKEEYNFRYDEEKRNGYISGVLIRSIVEDFFATKQNGFFIEAGALDGEYMSHTLRLEQYQGWTGLLAEPDKTNYKELTERHRKAWTTNTCLSIHDYPEEVLLTRLANPSSGSGYLNRGTFGIVQENSLESSQNIVTNSLMTSAQCLPVSSLLASLNITFVDLFILDVEKAENQVLRTFPFETVTVEVWAIEHNGDSEDEQFVEFMISKGYYYFDMLCDFVSDYIFVRKASEIYKKLNIPIAVENRTTLCEYKKEIYVNSNRNGFTPEHLRDLHHFPQLQYREVPVIHKKAKSYS